MRLNLNSPFSYIRDQVSQSSLTKSCGGEGCQVYLTDIPQERIVIDVEKEFDARQNTQKRADRLLFYGNAKNIFAVPIELKRGKAQESDVREKLENSLKFAATFGPDPEENRKTVFVPVLFHGRGIKWTNPKRQRSLKVNFQGKGLKVLIGRCDQESNLARLLSQAKYL